MQVNLELAALMRTVRVHHGMPRPCPFSHRDYGGVMTE